QNSFDTSPAAGAVLAFAILFVPSFVIVKLLARKIGGKTRRHAFLGPIDRVLGGGFGALKGLLGVTLFFLLANLATDMVYGPKAARPAVVFDTLARLIRHEFGEKSLIYARNVTDVDDKIIASAEAEGVDPSVITERYERFYLEDMGALGVTPPDIAPHATQEIPQMIAMIERLIGLGHAYKAE